MNTEFINFQTIKEILTSPALFIRAINRVGLLSWVSDESYIKWRYKSTFKKKLDLENPKKFSEKLQWLKLYDRKPIYTEIVDKFEVRKFIEEKLGEDILIPLLGHWEDVESIEWDKLPNQFVLKATHDSGGVVICKDKTTFDFEEAKIKLNDYLSRNYYLAGREWPYKHVKPRIIAEKYMVDESGYELKDYKFFCFNGEPKLLQVDFDREEGHVKNLYDLEWNLLDFEYNVPNNPDKHIEKPRKFDEMIENAGKLSSGIPYVRVDFYSINDEIFFGEMTLYPTSGFGKFNPLSYDDLLGSYLELPEKTQ